MRKIPKTCVTIEYVKEEKDVSIEKIEDNKYKVYILEGSIKKFSETNS